MRDILSTEETYNEICATTLELLADSLYGSDANCEQALEKHDVTVIAPVMLGNQKKTHLADFELNNQGRIIACPKGMAPGKVKKKTKCGFSASFRSSTCLQCEDFDQCPVSKGKKACYYRYKRKDIPPAHKRQNEDSPTFKNKYRYRAGVEATMSEYDRRTDVNISGFEA